MWRCYTDVVLKRKQDICQRSCLTSHCVKWGVSRCWNHTIRTCILQEYGHTRTRRVPRHATCAPRVRNRIRSDSDLTRDLEIPMSGYVIETRRVETWKFTYAFRFAANNNIPYIRAHGLSKTCLFHCSENSFTRCSCTEVPRYKTNRSVL